MATKCWHMCSYKTFPSLIHLLFTVRHAYIRTQFVSTTQIFELCHVPGLKKSGWFGNEVEKEETWLPMHGNLSH